LITLYQSTAPFINLYLSTVDVPLRVLTVTEFTVMEFRAYGRVGLGNRQYEKASSGSGAAEEGQRPVR
jgi:hypothetical protein